MMYRAGDRVSVMGTVKFDQVPGDMLVHVDLDGDSVSRPIVAAEHLKLVSREFKVGDRIRFKSAGDVGAVLAVHEYADGSAVLFVELENGAIVTAIGEGVEVVGWSA